MAEAEIQVKLQTLLKGTRLFSHEMEVVYFFVELRKLMDHNRGTYGDRYKNVRFYCDWVVHTEKSRNLDDLKPVFDELYRGCQIRIEQENVRALQLVQNFLYFKELRQSLVQLFRELHLDMFMLTDKSCWQSFVKQMLQILHEQPIVFGKKSGSPIKEIVISDVSDRQALIAILFMKPIKDPRGDEQDYLELQNGFGF